MLLDSNIVIYAATTQTDEMSRLIDDPEAAVSFVTYIEVLGYQGLDERQESFCESFFHAVAVLDLTCVIARRAVYLRQQRRMSLGDSIIAATALVPDLPLATRNVRDFRWISELTVADAHAS